jgi:hypothetical protein
VVLSVIRRDDVIRRLTVEAVRGQLCGSSREECDRAQRGGDGRLELDLSGYEVSVLRWDPRPGLDRAGA